MKRVGVHHPNSRGRTEAWESIPQLKGKQNCLTCSVPTPRGPNKIKKWLFAKTRGSHKGRSGRQNFFNFIVPTQRDPNKSRRWLCAFLKSSEKSEHFGYKHTR